MFTLTQIQEVLIKQTPFKHARPSNSPTSKSKIKVFQIAHLKPITLK